MHPGHRLRRAANVLNGSTLAGMVVASAGGAGQLFRDTNGDPDIQATHRELHEAQRAADVELPRSAGGGPGRGTSAPPSSETRAPKRSRAGSGEIFPAIRASPWRKMTERSIRLGGTKGAPSPDCTLTCRPLRVR